VTVTAFESIFTDELESDTADIALLRQARLRRDGACRGWPTEWFYPGRGAAGAEAAMRATAICGLCPVRAPCLAFALNLKDRFGIWGGLSEVPRRALHALVEQGNTIDDIAERAVSGEFATQTAERRERRQLAANRRHGNDDEVAVARIRAAARVADQRMAKATAAVGILDPLMKARYNQGRQHEPLADDLGRLPPLERDAAWAAARFLGFKLPDQPAPAPIRRRRSLPTKAAPQPPWRVEVSSNRWIVEADPTTLTEGQREAFGMLFDAFMPVTAA